MQYQQNRVKTSALWQGLCLIIDLGGVSGFRRGICQMIFYQNQIFNVLPAVSYGHECLLTYIQAIIQGIIGP